uniref:Uncharacterized protein n=1 Tax=Enterobacter asburiae TaxID=61645 RepID=A0A455W6R8_ENTAS|nr:hypothetical protein MRY18106EAS_P0780 [Enterobacter asburiae]
MRLLNNKLKSSLNSGNAHVQDKATVRQLREYDGLAADALFMVRALNKRQRQVCQKVIL